MALDTLKFKVAIEDQTKQAVEEIESRLAKLRDVKINVEVPNGGKIQLELPDLSKFTSQLTDSKRIMDEVFSNKNWLDIPSMKNAISGIKELTEATQKLKNGNEAINGTGTNTKYYEQLTQTVTNLKKAFSDLPNMSSASLPSFVASLSSAMANLNKSMEGKNLSKSAVEQISLLNEAFRTFNTIAGDPSGLAAFKTQVAAVMSIVITEIRNVLNELNNLKKSISNDNFTAFTNRIDKAATSLGTLTEAMERFHMTVGKDEGMKNFMEGLGAVIRNVKATMGDLNKAMNPQAQSGADYFKNLDQLNRWLEQVQRARVSVSGALTNSERTLVDVGDKDRLTQYNAELKQTEQMLIKLRTDSETLKNNELFSAKVGNGIGASISGTRQMSNYVESLTKVRFALDDMERMRTKLEASSIRGKGIVDTQGTKDALAALDQFKTKLMSVDRITGAGMLGGDYQRMMQGFTETMAKQEVAMANTRNYNVMLKETGDLLQRLENAGMKGLGLNIDTTKTDKAMGDMQKFADQLLMLDKGNFGDNHALDKQIEKFHELKRAANEAAKEQEKANNATEKKNAKANTEAARQSKIDDKSIKDATAEIDRLQEKLQQLNDKRNANIAIQADTSKVDAAIQNTEARIRQLQQIIKSGGTDASLGTTSSLKGSAGYKRGTEVAKGNEVANDAAFKTYTQSLEKASLELSKLKLKEKELQGIKDKSVALKVDTTAIDAAIQKVQALQQHMEKAIAEKGKYTVNGQNMAQFTGSSAYKTDMLGVNDTAKQQAKANAEAARQETQALRENIAAKKRARAAAHEMSAAERELVAAINAATSSASRQSQVMSDLKSMAMQYLSVYGVQQFVTNMTQITGELELQKKSLEVILDNASTAQNMYNEIRDLSQMSPFTFEELLKSHRQLAAFGIEAKDVFSTLKSLTDIGAGLDVDISRLILAFGHTRSYGYLSGIQNRQFENAGIDMVGALTAKYNELAEAEKKAGREATFVTRRDVFSRMRAKEIPFADVQDVILDLDRPGGKFYNMQIRQFDTLGGKLRNLNNNYRIMMSEIGQSNHGILSGVVDMINDVTEHWRKYKDMLMGIVGAYAAYKIAAIAANAAVGKSVVSSNAAIATALSKQQMDAAAVLYSNNQARGVGTHGVKAKLRSMGVAMLGGSDASNYRGRLEGSRSINNAVLDVGRNKQMSSITKQRIALTGRLTAAQRGYLLASAGVDKVEARKIAHWSAMRRHLLALRLSLVDAGQAAKAFALSMLANPMTWIFAVVGVLTSIISKVNAMKDAAAELGKTMRENANTNIDGLKQTLKEYEGITREYTPDRGDGKPSTYSTSGETATLRLVKLDKAQLEGRDLEAMFNEIKEKLEKQSPMFDADYFDIHKFNDQKDKIEEGLNKLKKSQYVNEVVAQSGERIGNAIAEGSGGFLWAKGEDYSTNAKDYNTAYQSFVNSITISETQYNKLKKEEKAKIEEYMRDLGKSRQEAIAHYILNNDPYDMSAYLKSYAVATGRKVGDQRREVTSGTEDVQRIATQMSDVMLTAFKGDPEQMTRYFEQVMNDILSSAKVGNADVVAHLSAEMRNAIVASMEAAGQKKEAAAFKEQAIRASVEALAGKELQDSVKKGDNAETQAKKVKEAVRKAMAKVAANDPALAKEWARMGKSQAEAYAKGFEGVAALLAHSIANIEGWQERARKKGMGVVFDLDIDYITYIQKQHKEIKEKAEKALSQKNRMKAKFKVDIDFELVTDPKKVQHNTKVIVDNINKAINNLFASGKAGTEDGQSDVKELRSMREQYLGINRIATYLASEDQLIKDPKKEKNGNKKNWIDREAEALEEYLRLLREAGNLYKEWEKRKGKDAAITEVKKQYEDLFKNLISKSKFLQNAGFTSDFAINHINDLRKGYEQIAVAAEKRYNYVKKAKDERYAANALKVLREAKKALSDLDISEFDKGTERWKSKMERDLDELERKYKRFQSVRKATGDDIIAAEVADLTGKIDNYRNVADALAKRISELANQNGLSLGNLGDYMNMDDKQIDDSVKDIFNSARTDKNGNVDNKNTDPQMIAGLVELVKKWKTLTRELEDDTVDAYSSIVEKANLYTTRLDKILSDFNNDIERINRKDPATGKFILSDKQRKKAATLATGKRDTDLMELKPEAQSFFKSVEGYSKKAIHELSNNLLKEYKAIYDKGGMTGEQYTERVSNVAATVRQSENRNSGKSIYDRMGFLGGTYFDPSKQENQTALSNELETLGIRRDAAAASGDTDLVAVLDRLIILLEKIIAGVGGTSAISDAANLGNVAGRWDATRTDANGNIVPVMSDKAKKKAANKAKKDSDEDDGEDKGAAWMEMFNSALEKACKGLQDFSSVADFVSGALDSLGFGDASNAVGDAGGIASSMMGGASALSSLGPYGMAAGAALGLVSGIAQAKDKALEREIQGLKEDVSKIEGYTKTISQARERTLGYDNGDVIREYQSAYAQKGRTIELPGTNIKISTSTEGAAGAAMASYYNAAGGGKETGYQQEYALLQEKRQKYVEMYNAEDKKKHSSEASKQEYLEKIAELDDEIRYFAEDLADELYGINLKDWAAQLSDALTTAFENGESAAEAYGDTVKSIMQSVLNNMLKIGILEPMMKQLENALFGYTDANGNKVQGLFNAEDPESSIEAVMAYIGKFFGSGGNGEKAIQASNEYMEAFESLLSQYGLSLKNDDTSELSSGISGVSEETADLLAGYVNALRQDVAVNRMLLTQFVTELWGDYADSVTSGMKSLAQIEQDVATIRRAMINGEGNLFEEIQSIRSILRDVTVGTKRVYMQ